MAISQTNDSFFSSDWWEKSSNVAVVSGGFQVAGGLLSSISQYKQAKENYNTALENADEIRRYADEVAQDLRDQQVRREASNIVSISTSGLAGGSFTDALREDILETNKQAQTQRNALYAKAAEMEKQARKQKRKARDKKRLGTALAVGSVATAPFTGGASLMVGGATMGALNQYY